MVYFEILYKKGKENVVADALCRIEKVYSLYSITYPINMWLEEACHEWKEENNTTQKIQCLKEEKPEYNIFISSIKETNTKGASLLSHGETLKVP